VLGREHATDGGGFHGAQEEARERERQQLVEVRPAQRGQSDRRQPFRHLAEQLHAARLQPEPGRRENAADHDEERHRDALHEHTAEDEQRERGEPDGERRRIRLAEVPEEVAAVLPEAPVGAGEPEELRQLRAGEEQRHAALEADHHALGDEVHDRARLDEPRDERDERDQERRPRRERTEPRRVPTRDLAERRADQDGDGGRDRDDRVPRAAEEPEHQPAEQAGVQSGFRRKPGERGVAEPGRQEIRGERDACGHVVPEPAALVRAQPGDGGNGDAHDILRLV
jgi:hypothetical protein